MLATEKENIRQELEKVKNESQEIIFSLEEENKKYL